MGLKKRVVSAAAVGAIVLGCLFAAPTAAFASGNPSALDQGDFTQQCMNQNGLAGWQAQLLGSTAYSWKCVYIPGGRPNTGIDINAYCMSVWGVWAATPVASDPYSWHCHGY